MTPEERQVLREKHAKCFCGHCDSNECSAGCVGDYPCDVLDVLDVLDQIALWVDHHNIFDAHGAIERIREVLL